MTFSLPGSWVLIQKETAGKISSPQIINLYATPGGITPSHCPFAFVDSARTFVYISRRTAELFYFFSRTAVIPTHPIRKDKTDQQASKRLSVFGRDFIKLEYSIRDSTPFSGISLKGSRDERRKRGIGGVLRSDIN